MEKCQKVIEESATGTRVIAQPHEAKGCHLKVRKFDVILSCWWVLVLVLVNPCWWNDFDVRTTKVRSNPKMSSSKLRLFGLPSSSDDIESSLMGEKLVSLPENESSSVPWWPSLYLESGHLAMHLLAFSWPW
jgi:hypothetical protein